MSTSGTLHDNHPNTVRKRDGQDPLRIGPIFVLACPLPTNFFLGTIAPQDKN